MSAYRRLGKERLLFDISGGLSREVDDALQNADTPSRRHVFPVGLFPSFLDGERR